MNKNILNVVPDVYANPKVEIIHFSQDEGSVDVWLNQAVWQENGVRVSFGRFNEHTKQFSDLETTVVHSRSEIFEIISRKWGVGQVRLIKFKNFN